MSNCLDKLPPPYTFPVGCVAGSRELQKLLFPIIPLDHYVSPIFTVRARLVLISRKQYIVNPTSELRKLLGHVKHLHSDKSDKVRQPGDCGTDPPLPSAKCVLN